MAVEMPAGRYRREPLTAVDYGTGTLAASLLLRDDRAVFHVTGLLRTGGPYLCANGLHAVAVVQGETGGAVMPTFRGAARDSTPRSAACVPRLSSLYPPPMNHVFGIFRPDTGQGEVELDFRERVQFPIKNQAGVIESFHLLRVFVPDDLRDKPLARCESEVIVQVLVAGDVDLGRQVTMSRRRNEEMDVRRPLPMPTKLVH
jgi:hypothetical protein